MTDVELLPLPSPQVPFIDCDPSMTDIRRLVRWYEQGATEYARANVAHAVAPLQAEIEALRAEVGELHMHAKRRDQYAVEKAAQALDWKKRAERLAELLGECYEWLFESMSDGPRVSEGALTNGSYTRAFRDLHEKLHAVLHPTAAQENDDA